MNGQTTYDLATIPPGTDTLGLKQAEMFELVRTVSYAYRMTCMYTPNNAPYLRDFTFPQVSIPFVSPGETVCSYQQDLHS